MPYCKQEQALSLKGIFKSNPVGGMKFLGSIMQWTPPITPRIKKFPILLKVKMKLKPRTL